MKQILFVAAAVVMFVAFAVAGEREISNAWCESMGGKAEYRLADGSRVDCLLDEYAVEVEYTSKWYESIGQSLYYAMLTCKKPGIVFIRKDGDENHKARIDRFLRCYPEFTVWWVERGDYAR